MTDKLEELRHREILELAGAQGMNSVIMEMAPVCEI
jgi:hypothetical protein